MALRGQESGRDGAARGSNLGKYGTGANLGGQPGVRGDVPRGRAGMGDGARAWQPELVLPAWHEPNSPLPRQRSSGGDRWAPRWRDRGSLRGRKAGPVAGAPSREQRLDAGGASLDHRGLAGGGNASLRAGSATSQVEHVNPGAKKGQGSFFLGGGGGSPGS